MKLLHHNKPLHPFVAKMHNHFEVLSRRPLSIALKVCDSPAVVVSFVCPDYRICRSFILAGTGAHNDNDTGSNMVPGPVGIKEN